MGQWVVKTVAEHLSAEDYYSFSTCERFLAVTLRNDESIRMLCERCREMSPKTIQNLLGLDGWVGAYGRYVRRARRLKNRLPLPCFPLYPLECSAIPEQFLQLQDIDFYDRKATYRFYLADHSYVEFGCSRDAVVACLVQSKKPIRDTIGRSVLYQLKSMFVESKPSQVTEWMLSTVYWFDKNQREFMESPEQLYHLGQKVFHNCFERSVILREHCDDVIRVATVPSIHSAPPHVAKTYAAEFRSGNVHRPLHEMIHQIPIFSHRGPDPKVRKALMRGATVQDIMNMKYLDSTDDQYMDNPLSYTLGCDMFPETLAEFRQITRCQTSCNMYPSCIRFLSPKELLQKLQEMDDINMTK